MPHPLFGPEVRYMLQEDDKADMTTFCETLHPATVAEALADEFDVEEVWRFLQNTSIKNQAAIFEYFPIDWQVKMVAGTGAPHMARLIEQMSHDDRADLLRRLQPQAVEGLLRLVDQADRRDIAMLVRYEENTAGALMTTEYAWLPETITAAEALERLRLQAPDRETIYYVYVLDDQRKLLGVVSLRDLILAPRTALLRDIMEKDVQRVKVTDDRENVANEMARYDLLAIPVVDEEGRLVGIVTHDDVMDVVVQEATKDVHLMGGVGPLAENYLQANFVTVWRKRAFWLACLFLAELFTFTALAHFEDAIAEVVVLSLFVPLCISTGGNSGSQAATLITRAMALGHVSAMDWLRVLRHELLMGLVLGLTLGCIGFFRAAVTPEKVRGNSPPRDEAFQVKLPRGQELSLESDNTVDLPSGTPQYFTEDHEVRVTLPEGGKLEKLAADDPEHVVYQFPKKCTMQHDPVSRWTLALVISQAVAAICVWGTLMGSMLPLVFKKLGVDPGIASSPFVATFVDVTGIVIYFTIATTYLRL
jgi:magnesium transporter